MFVIGWGDGNNQLKITPTWREYGADTTEYEEYLSIGPSIGIADTNVNIYFISSYFGQLKCFNNKGELILDRSNLAEGVCPNPPHDMFLDSLGHIYLTTEPPINYVPVTNLEGKLLTRLFPYPDTSKLIYRLYHDISGTLFFWSLGDNISMAYSGGDFKAVANTCMMGNNGYLYTIDECSEEYPHAIKFIRYNSPDRSDSPDTTDSTFVEIPGHNIFYNDLIIGGDGSKLYIFLSKFQETSSYLYIYDLEYRLLDEITFPELSETYTSGMSPFVDRRGNVYEFRFMDDGLHVIKWTKQ